MLSTQGRLIQGSWNTTAVLRQRGRGPVSIGHAALSISNRQSRVQTKLVEKFKTQRCQIYFSSQGPIKAHGLLQFTLLVPSPEFLSGLVSDPALQARFSIEGQPPSCSENRSQRGFTRFIKSLHQGKIPQRPISGNCSVSWSESWGQI